MKFNEDLLSARKVSEYFGTNHHEIIVHDDDSLSEILPKLVYQMDEPHANPTIVPTYLVSKLAKENGIKVLLSGDGSDEIFCGYRRYVDATYINHSLKLPFFMKKLIRPLSIKRVRSASRYMNEDDNIKRLIIFYTGVNWDLVPVIKLR